MVWSHVHFDVVEKKKHVTEQTQSLPSSHAVNWVLLLLTASRLTVHLSRCTLRLVKRRRQCLVAPGRYEDIEITCALRAPQASVLYSIDSTVPTKLGRFVAVLTADH